MNPRMKSLVEHTRSILRTAIAVADPGAAVNRALHRRGGRLEIGGESFDLDGIQQVFIIAAGKASLAMASAASTIVGDRFSAGIAVTTGGSDAALPGFSVYHARHPVPDRSGIRAAEAVLELADRAGERDLVLVLISGGASALLPAPVEGVTLSDKGRTTQLLLKSGAAIDEVNMVRKHLSRIKGGWLASRIYPAATVALLLSDVISGDLSTIGSGPTVPDPSRFDDAVRVLKNHGVWTRLPRSVRKYFEQGVRSKRPETPKPGDPSFSRVFHHIVADNRQSVASAAMQAETLGYDARVLSTTLQGEAREVARVFGAVAREIDRTGRPLKRPACLIAGGELTVSVRGRGTGGRAQEFALAGAVEISGMTDTAMVGFGTDGVDGPTQAAGAIADGTTMKRAAEKGVDFRKRLSDNDAFSAFKVLGDLILTGPTGTNVNDLYILLMPSPPEEPTGNS